MTFDEAVKWCDERDVRISRKGGWWRVRIECITNCPCPLPNGFEWESSDLVSAVEKLRVRMGERPQEAEMGRVHGGLLVLRDVGDGQVELKTKDPETTAPIVYACVLMKYLRKVMGKDADWVRD